MPIVIHCSACGHEYRIAEGKLPPGGAKIRCRVCQAVFEAKPPEDHIPPPPEPGGMDGGDVPGIDAPPDAPRESGWAARTAEGEEDDLGLTELKEMVRTERILETDSVRIPGTDDWVVAGRVPELRRYFRIKARVAGEDRLTVTEMVQALACSTHREYEARWVCPNCNTAFCEQCITYKEVQTVRLAWCEKCDGAAQQLAVTKEIVPFWKRLGECFAYPFHRKGLIPFIVYVVISVCIALVRMMPAFGGWFSLLLFLYIAGYNLHMIRESSKGKDYPPEFPEMSDVFSDMVMPALKFFLVTIVAFLLAILWGIFGLALVPPLLWFATLVLLVVVGLILYPMVLAILAIWGGLFASMNPVLLFRLIGRMAKDYTIFLLFWYPGWILVAIIGYFARNIPFGTIPAAAIHAYFFVVMAHMLGWLCYQNEERLAWD